ncbi:2-C-methyl-D-erythritol 4-phosphate cytidylyltransferase [Sinomonas atrocyanea]|jgi:2-C-methyl-D-erythritol 4-phosphate cytidylyltransferase|uniref:2-C-methyl-D-erythritol 4-phosphate cytidylyltransferase n=1 Tax=Sinomonas atrocyanea TaxID=37927 RepID=UPI002781E861|nr:2-C-methyl-D-erythritol 4-phosphate cytidylyltransferase [Sinomonas atrocyanea]MDQ0259605.1 2-C-methyl-D-erythritol 4-phosphate cytidylyltransferase [Sinomonas atrocyanea]MDR6623137.1 2-C-methyl-D-erythritol 4-phosphate cytidylyltransferase [Sinomonas atrocyanea]
MTDASPQPASPTAVVIVAAGSGTRLGYGVPKALVPLAGAPLLLHALRGAAGAGIARQICVAVPEGDTELTELCRTFAEELGELAPEITAVPGGQTRADSVRAALAALAPGTVHVLVHDAARPLTPSEVFHRVAEALERGAGAVVPAIPVVDTIKSTAPTEGEAAAVAAEVVTGTAVREQLRAVQTPQGFDVAALRSAHELAATWDPEQAAAITDDAMLLESIGTPVYVVPGDLQAFKVTTPMDLHVAETLVAAQG